MTIIQALGYLSSFLILISFVMKDMRKLRIINLFGCSGFIIYGFINTAIPFEDVIPIIITNGAIVLINVYYLYFKAKE